jgi:hypothetical protein
MFWKLPPGEAREKAKLNYESRRPIEIRGPSKSYIDGNVAVGHWRCPFDPGNPASAIWARLAVMAPRDELALIVQPKFKDGVLYVNHHGRDFYVGNTPSPRDIHTLYHHIRRFD